MLHKNGGNNDSRALAFSRLHSNYSTLALGLYKQLVGAVALILKSSIPVKEEEEEKAKNGAETSLGQAPPPIPCSPYRVTLQVQGRESHTGREQGGMRVICVKSLTWLRVRP